MKWLRLSVQLIQRKLEKCVPGEAHHLVAGVKSPFRSCGRQILWDYPRFGSDCPSIAAAQKVFHRIADRHTGANLKKLHNQAKARPSGGTTNKTIIKETFY